MPITERTLKKWRQEALTTNHETSHIGLDGMTEEKTVKLLNDLNDRILRMTQELLDQHLIRRI